MRGVHAPERQPGETQAAYRERRAASAAAVRSMRCVGLGGGQTSRAHQRGVKRRNRTLHGTYGEGLLQPQRRRNQAKQRGPRDENGAITLVGATVEFEDYRPDPARWFETGGGTHPNGFVAMARRIWLAGISAWRGH